MSEYTNLLDLTIGRAVLELRKEVNILSSLVIPDGYFDDIYVSGNANFGGDVKINGTLNVTETVTETNLEVDAALIEVGADNNTPQFFGVFDKDNGGDSNADTNNLHESAFGAYAESDGTGRAFTYYSTYDPSNSNNNVIGNAEFDNVTSNTITSFNDTTTMFNIYAYYNLHIEAVNNMQITSQYGNITINSATGVDIGSSGIRTTVKGPLTANGGVTGDITSNTISTLEITGRTPIGENSYLRLHDDNNIFLYTTGFPGIDTNDLEDTAQIDINNFGVSINADLVFNKNNLQIIFRKYPDTNVPSNYYKSFLSWPTMTADQLITLPDNSGTVCVAGTNGVTLDSSTGTMRSTTGIINDNTTLNTSGTWYVNGTYTVTIDPSNVTDDGIFITLFGKGGNNSNRFTLKNTVDTNNSITIDAHDTVFIIIKGTTESDIIVRKYHAGKDESWN